MPRIKTLFFLLQVLIIALCVFGVSFTAFNYESLFFLVSELVKVIGYGYYTSVGFVSFLAICFVACEQWLEYCQYFYGFMAVAVLAIPLLVLTDIARQYPVIEQIDEFNDFDTKLVNTVLALDDIDFYKKIQDDDFCCGTTFEQHIELSTDEAIKVFSGVRCANVVEPPGISGFDRMEEIISEINITINVEEAISIANFDPILSDDFFCGVDRFKRVARINLYIFFTPFAGLFLLIFASFFVIRKLCTDVSDLVGQDYDKAGITLAAEGEWHSTSFFSTLYLFASIIAYVVITLTGEESDERRELISQLVLLSAVLLYGYEAFIRQCFPGGVLKDLSSNFSAELAINSIQVLKGVAPIITFHIQCYHYDEYRVDRRDSEGRWHTSYYQKKVNSHSATKQFMYSSWSDISELTALEEAEANGGFFQGEKYFLKYKVNYSYRPGDAQSQEEFNRQQDIFMDEHNIDTHHKFWLTYNMSEGYLKKLDIKSEEAQKSCFFSVTVYVLFTLLGLNWPYRMFMERYTDRRIWHNAKLYYASGV